MCVDINGKPAVAGQVIAINLNVTAKVILTEQGAAFYEEYRKQCRYPPKPVQAGEVLRDQLWHIMQVFGSSLVLGGLPPFKDLEVEIST